VRDGHAAEDAGRLGIERHWIEFGFDPLQNLQPPGSLGMSRWVISG
jgi:hypothetical protein